MLRVGAGIAIAGSTPALRPIPGRLTRASEPDGLDCARGATPANVAFGVGGVPADGAACPALLGIGDATTPGGNGCVGAPVTLPAGETLGGEGAAPSSLGNPMGLGDTTAP